MQTRVAQAYPVVYSEGSTQRSLDITCIGTSSQARCRPQTAVDRRGARGVRGWGPGAPYGAVAA